MLLPNLFAFLTTAWPSLYAECSTFPALGEAQPRYKTHPPIAWVCDAVPGGGANFTWCAQHCVARTNGTQNCSSQACTCVERCMGNGAVCTGSGAHPPKDGSHASLPDALAAAGGSTVLSVDGGRNTTVVLPGTTQRVSIAPGTVDGGSSAQIWYLLDAGVGSFRADGDADPPLQWKLSCNGTRAAFAAGDAETVTVLWTAPTSLAAPVALRVAAARAMGNISVNALVLGAAGQSPPPDDGARYACAQSEGFTIYDREVGATRQCVRVPAQSGGALSQTACAAACYGSAAAAPGRTAFACQRCAHVYDAQRDGGGLAFEELPATWVCPTCGAPKWAYVLRLLDDGAVAWEHA